MDHVQSADDAMMCTEPVVGLLEDDDDLRDELAAGLRRYGFTVWGVGTAAEFAERLLEQPCNAVVIDVGLPGVDGLTVTSRLRAQSDVIIVMVTGRGHEDDRVRGLECGADAYLVKPVGLSELSAVLLGGLRRLWMGRTAGTPAPAGARHANVWVLDPAHRELIAPDAAWRLRLTQSESRFVAHLLAQHDRVVTREEAAQAVHPEGQRQDDLHWIDMLVSRLRRKAAQGGIDLPLRAVRGQGYRFFTG
ncbi:response regulator transcription factor [Achromobacter sp. GG226]|uniref:response regulator transcription factor n=1 Tax=Verticiella alkaliphila TaxID=2779529 RepID=UPI001C0D39DC|nr:response regulator transcription factor [Verticiella sp. GG226]MBU4610940.1 response regulator transcription factor [Verticiella sp. GG226]